MLRGSNLSKIVKLLLEKQRPVSYSEIVQETGVLYRDIHTTLRFFRTNGYIKLITINNRTHAFLVERYSEKLAKKLRQAQ